MFARVTVLALAGLLLQSSGLSAQLRANETPIASLGINFVGAEPTGEFDDFIDAGFGADFMGRIPLDRNGLVSLRADVGFLIYGHESKDVCLEGVGCRVEGRLKTDNSIFTGGIGPELGVPLGWVRPYVNAFIGYSYFATTSSLEDYWSDEDILETQNFGDGTFSWGLGWGMEVDVSQGRMPIAINIGARYLENGHMAYLTEGDIVDHPDGSVSLYPNYSEANLIAFRIGVTIGIPRGAQEDDRLSSQRRW